MLTSEDVQLTKDNVPVIYHDFLMSETGIDAPLHNLSLEQVILTSPGLPQYTYKLTLTVHVHQRGAVDSSRFAIIGGEEIQRKMWRTSRCWLQNALTFFERLRTVPGQESGRAYEAYFRVQAQRIQRV